jgi:hypothetical protein
MVYVGMDVHPKRTQVAVLGEDGTQLMNRNVPNDPGELAAILGPLGRGTPAVFEAAYGGGGSRSSARISAWRRIGSLV